MDERIEILDPAMRDVVRPDSTLRCIAAGFRFTEGPAWWAAKGCLIFSDIPGDTVYCWSEGRGHRVWRQPSRHANGHTVDRRGRLITCEHGSRAVTRTDLDGRTETLASTYGGRKLNSPNDVVVKSDETIWFTDPPYGIRPEEREQEGNHVFRLDPGAQEPVIVAAGLSRPNGLCFSPDESLLYIADSDVTIHHVRRFRVTADNTLSGGEVFATIVPGVPDGMRVDSAGRLFSTAADGVQVYDPQGRLLGRIRTPQTAANCAFGGPDGRTLFITATSRLWAADLV